MPKEIERKFLVKSDMWRQSAEGVPYVQAYIEADCTVRIRLVGNDGFITLKGRPTGLTRSEFEYAIPAEDAKAMITELCKNPYIEKTRYKVVHANHVWEIDEFHGDNTGLIVAEIELSEEKEAFAKPDWLGAEVTDDGRYYNASLVEYPFKDW